MTCRAISIVLLLAACGSSSDAPRPTTFGDDRPVDLQVPMGFSADKQYPLILILHGYSATGFVQETFFGAKSLVNDGSAFVLAPDGLVDSMGNQYWNADPQCCDFDHTGVDDSSYLAKLVTDVKAAWPIDRVLVMGHSNGGYMTYRFTCDHADLVDGMMVLAGAYPTTSCTPSRAVPLIHIHGDQDAEVPYSLGLPSATSWATDDGCGAFSPGPTYDLDSMAAGAETSSQIASCPAGPNMERAGLAPARGIDVEFWTMAGVGHIPSYTSAFMPTIWGWFTSL